MATSHKHKKVNQKNIDFIRFGRLVQSHRRLVTITTRYPDDVIVEGEKKIYITIRTQTLLDKAQQVGFQKYRKSVKILFLGPRVLEDPKPTPKPSKKSKKKQKVNPDDYLFTLYTDSEEAKQYADEIELRFTDHKTGRVDSIVVPRHVVNIVVRK